MKTVISKSLPARNKTMAFRQANSAGSTCTPLKRISVSARIRTSALELPFLTCSFTLNRGLADTSRGMHHWIAFNRNSSLHASSKRITWKKEKKGLMSLPFDRHIKAHQSSHLRSKNNKFIRKNLDTPFYWENLYQLFTNYTCLFMFRVGPMLQGVRSGQNPLILNRYQVPKYLVNKPSSTISLFFDLVKLGC